MSRKQRMEQLLHEKLNPSVLIVEDESHKHHVPKDAETHFKVIAVSSLFHQLTRIARHRLVNKLLDEEFSLGLHALSLHLYTSEEWETAEKSIIKSPPCKDGFKK